MNIKNATPKELMPIIKNICSQFLITFEELIGDKTQNLDTKEARAIVCYYLFAVNGYSPASLARILRKSRSNVYNTSKRVSDEMETNKNYKLKIERIINLLK